MSGGEHEWVTLVAMVGEILLVLLVTPHMYRVYIALVLDIGW
jgi:hypothetical protein